MDHSSRHLIYSDTVDSRLSNSKRMKRGKGIIGRDDRSSGIEILMSDAFAKINPTEPLRLSRQVARRKTE